MDDLTNKYNNLLNTYINNENENIKPFLQRTEKVLNKMEKSYEIIFVKWPNLLIVSIKIAIAT